MIAGPTASGKSQLAIDLATRMDAEVINADAMQLYADLNILTARPQPDEMAGVPHHLYGVIGAAHRASVSQWLDLAAAAMAEMRGRGKIPIIVGGTGMYLGAAITGIAPVPDVPTHVHEECSDLYDNIGGAAFKAQLAVDDPVIAARLADGDRQRLIRALGVLRASGTPLSTWQAQPHKGALKGRPLMLAKLLPRETLYARIDARFDLMLASGALDEVRRLAQRKLDPGLPCMKALGVTMLQAVLEGSMTQEDANNLSKRDSRHYAKRQMTWLRNNYNTKMTINEKLSESLFKKIFSYIR